MNGKYLIKMTTTTGLKIDNLKAQLDKLFAHGYVINSHYRIRTWSEVSLRYWPSSLISVKYLMIGDNASCKMVMSFYFDDPIRETDFYESQHYEMVTVEEMLKKEGVIC